MSLYADQDRIYQQVGRTFVRYPLAEFDNVPAAGTNVRTSYEKDLAHAISEHWGASKSTEFPERLRRLIFSPVSLRAIPFKGSVIHGATMLMTASGADRGPIVSP